MSLHRSASLSLALPLLLAGVAPAAPPPPERLLPAATLQFVCVPDVRQLRERWGRTQMSRFFNDPALKPFLDDLDRQLPAGLTQFLGLSTDDVTRVAFGPVAWAVVRTGPGKPANVLLIDATGKDGEMRRVQATLARWVQKRGGSSQEQDGLTLHAWAAGTPPQTYRLALAVKDGLFAASDSPADLRALLARWGGGGSLADNPAFKAVAAHCGAVDGQPVNLRWFLDPIGLADVGQAAAPPSRSGDRTLATLKKQGFDAVKGVGGIATVEAGANDLVYRAYIYAPPPYRNAMNMLRFPAGSDFTPPAWVPGDLSVYETFSWDLPQAFEAFAPLFDEVAGDGDEGAFQDVIDSLKNDPNGPGLDFRREIIAQLSGRVSIMTDAVRPATRKSERVLVALEAKPKSAGGNPEQVLAEAMRKSLQPDPAVKRRDFQGHVIWEIIAKEPKKGGKGGPPVKLPNAAIAVANGQLFIATHVGLLEQVLRKGDRPRLAGQADYQQVTRELERLGAGKDSLRLFARPAEDFRTTYELARLNQLEGAESVYSKLLLGLLKGAEADGLKVVLNGSLLPEFGTLSKHLGPAGAFVVSHPDGWELVGVQMKRLP
jgi:hypothetical protein